MRSLANRVFETIRQVRMLAPGDRAGVAVSGGADSVALLRILESLRDRLGIALLIVHFDHRLRGAESDADARFVEDLARARGLECIVGCEDVSAVAAAHKWNLEDAARRLRYAFFERVVAEGRATRVVVAHTADDQAETVLAHILRGTGPAGLAGIYPAVGSIVRPLLRERREELREYLRGLGQTWREDATNRDLSKQRARIREQLVPVLERDFSPRAVNHLAGLATLAREEEIFWSALVEDCFRALIRADQGTFGIRIHDLLAPMDLSAGGEAAALRTVTERLIRRIYRELRGGLGGLTAVHVEQVIRLASESASGRRAELPGGILVQRNFGDLIFSRTQRIGRRSRSRKTLSEANAYLYVVTLPTQGVATISVPELNSCFCLKVIDWSISERDTKGDSAALDADLLREPLILRSWRPGDAFRPRGRRQTKKLKEMFLAGRVPSRDRGCWPVLESGGRVAWARGMPPAEEFCVSDDTQSGVVIEEVQL
ncbi:MAG: tRNA lysidine(34) synthetase TilS [Candidatus Acidiferrales bacterium]